MHFVETCGYYRKEREELNEVLRQRFECNLTVPGIMTTENNEFLRLVAKFLVLAYDRNSDRIGGWAVGLQLDSISISQVYEPQNSIDNES